MFEGRIIT